VETLELVLSNIYWSLSLLRHPIKYILEFGIIWDKTKAHAVPSRWMTGATFSLLEFWTSKQVELVLRRGLYVLGRGCLSVTVDGNRSDVKESVVSCAPKNVLTGYCALQKCPRCLNRFYLLNLF
jgi:hypothetical protein